MVGTIEAKKCHDAMPDEKIELAGEAAESDRAVPSPCIGVCELDQQAGWCNGCYRTLPEIARWPLLPPADKRRILAALELRRGAV
jgi:predicted Fe-S protein YdhL (DUF1289 family)